MAGKDEPALIVDGEAEWKGNGGGGGVGGFDVKSGASVELHVLLGAFAWSIFGTTFVLLCNLFWWSPYYPVSKADASLEGSVNKATQFVYLVVLIASIFAMPAFIAGAALKTRAAFNRTFTLACVGMVIMVPFLALDHFPLDGPVLDISTNTRNLVFYLSFFIELGASAYLMQPFMTWPRSVFYYLSPLVATTCVSVAYSFLVFPWVWKTRSVSTKLAVRVFVHTVLFEGAVSYNRFCATKWVSNIVESRGLFVLFLQSVGQQALFGRLIIFNLGSSAATILSSLLIGGLEIFMRVSMHHRERFYRRVAAKLSSSPGPDAIHPSEHGSCESGDNDASKREGWTDVPLEEGSSEEGAEMAPPPPQDPDVPALPALLPTSRLIRAHFLVFEMMMEMYMIVMAGVFVIVCQTPGETGSALTTRDVLMSSAIMLVIEVCVDYICIVVELKQGFPLLAAAYDRRKGYWLAMFVTSVLLIPYLQAMYLTFDLEVKKDLGLWDKQ